MDMEKLHDKKLMHAFYIAYLDAFGPEGERQLLFCFFDTGCLIVLKNPPQWLKKPEYCISLSDSLHTQQRKTEEKWWLEFLKR